jgi:hypothetical protein
MRAITLPHQQPDPPPRWISRIAAEYVITGCFTQHRDRVLFEKSCHFIWLSSLSNKANKSNTGTKQKVCVGKSIQSSEKDLLHHDICSCVKFRWIKLILYSLVFIQYLVCVMNKIYTKDLMLSHVPTVGSSCSKQAIRRFRKLKKNWIMQFRI